jgi:ESCRT-II complex subunit VPS25
MKHVNKATFEIGESSGIEGLFNNEKIGRSLPKMAQIAVVDALVEKGNATWLAGGKSRVRVYWRSLEEWGNLAWKWADDNGLTTSPFTIEDLVNGDEAMGTEFHGADMETFIEAMKLLHEKKKAVFYPSQSGLLGDNGVRFIGSK